MRNILFGLLVVSVTGCAAYKKEIIKRDYEHQLYVTIESARIHGDAGCIVGNRIQEINDRYNFEMQKILNGKKYE